VIVLWEAILVAEFPSRTTDDWSRLLQWFSAKITRSEAVGVPTLSLDRIEHFPAIGQ
jgi:hypothetical protein